MLGNLLDWIYDFIGGGIKFIIKAFVIFFLCFLAIALIGQYAPILFIPIIAILIFIFFKSGIIEMIKIKNKIRTEFGSIQFFQKIHLFTSRRGVELKEYNAMKFDKEF